MTIFVLSGTYSLNSVNQSWTFTADCDIEGVLKIGWQSAKVVGKSLMASSLTHGSQWPRLLQYT